MIDQLKIDYAKIVKKLKIFPHKPNFYREYEHSVVGKRLIQDVWEYWSDYDGGCIVRIFIVNPHSHSGFFTLSRPTVNIYFEVRREPLDDIIVNGNYNILNHTEWTLLYSNMKQYIVKE